MQDYKILIVDDVHPLLIQELKKQGFRVDYFPNCKPPQIVELFDQHQALVIRSKCFLDDKLLQLLRGLKLIARAGSGMDNIDERAASQLGITMVNAPEANRDAVAELTIAHLLNLTRRLSIAHSEVKQLAWRREENRGIELEEQTLAIIGYGNCGQALSKKLSGFELNQIYFDKIAKGLPTEFAKPALLEQVFEQADIVSLHIPLTAETRGMVNKSWLSKFKKPIYLLNLSRGAIMITQDLIWALDNGIIKGLALDVLENENLKQLDKTEKMHLEQLASRENVSLSPHIGGWTNASYRKISVVLKDKILAFFTKDEISSPTDLEY